MQDRPIRLVCARREGGLEVPGPALWPIASIAARQVIDLLSAGNGLGIGPMPKKNLIWIAVIVGAEIGDSHQWPVDKLKDVVLGRA
jgi:hypothetical protein